MNNMNDSTNKSISNNKEIRHIKVIPQITLEPHCVYMKQFVISFPNNIYTSNSQKMERFQQTQVMCKKIITQPISELWRIMYPYKIFAMIAVYKIYIYIYCQEGIYRRKMTVVECILQIGVRQEVRKKNDQREGSQEQKISCVF